MNGRKTRFAWALLLGALFLFAIGLPDRTGAQIGPFGAGIPGVTNDLADIPLNRTGTDRLTHAKDAFFPSLLGLRSPGVKMIRTKHFYIYYATAEQTARRIAEIADDRLEQIASYYPTFLERYAPVHVLVDDGVDVLGNAFAIYSNNFIHFWATPLDWEVRGTKSWIRDTFTHELTHIITLKAAHHGWPFTFGLLNTTQANNNPDYSFTLPLYHIAAPAWFSEGIAQFESSKHGGDSWDTHRDMLLRMATLENDLLSYTDMGIFAKDGHHSEMVYNQGFAFLKYIEEVYGEEKVRGLVEKRPIVNFKSTIKKTLGISANRLYNSGSTLLASGEIKAPDDLYVKLRDGRDPLSQYIWDQFHPKQGIKEKIAEKIGEKIGQAMLGKEESQRIQKLLETEETEESRLPILVIWLNHIIQNRRLYDEQRFAHVTLSKDAKEQIAQNPQGDDLLRLNRLLLEEAYPDEIARGDKRQIVKGWVPYLKEKYGAVMDDIQATGEREGERVYDGGSLDYHPVYSPDGARMAFLGNEGSDYQITSLLVLDLATQKLTEVEKHVYNRFSWTSDGNELIYIKAVKGRWDIYTYDVRTKKSRRITAGLRGRDPNVSPDGKRVVFVGNGDGSNRIGIVEVTGAKVRYLTHHNDGTQYYGPKWSPDGNRILFSLFRGEDRDIAVINADATPRPKKTEKKKKEAEIDSTATFPDSLAYANNAGFEVLLRSAADERDPVWLPDGSGFIYSSDRTGIFNLYAFDLASGGQKQITNVLGGAFVPSVSPDGNDILYAGFHAADYSIYRIPLSYAVDVAAADTLSRDYRSIYTGEGVAELYDTGRYSTHLTSYGVTPLLLLGPTFIGNRFGLDQLSFGAQAAWGDLLGDDILVTGITIGKNLKRKTDLNSDMAVYYETGLTPILSEQKTYAPRLYVAASRQTINSLIDYGSVATRQDTMVGTLQTVIDSQLVIIPNVTQFLNLTMTEEDEYKDVFTDFVVGTEVGLGSRHAVSLDFSHRRYSENLGVKQVVLDSSRIFQQTDDGFNEITEEIPGIHEPQIALDDHLYRDLTFFRSSDLGATWQYRDFRPTKDAYLNPTGGRAVTFRYRRINATVTDSLALSTDLDRDNVPDATDADPSPTLFRADNVKLGLNEYIFSWNEFIPMFGRSTLALQGFVGYKDQPIKEVQQDGGTFEGSFYYPLRYYLGGLGTLRGYPYFSIAGGKVFFGRATFTFPIFQKVDKELPPFFFDKIYGTFFVETGATGNFESLKALLDSDNKFKRDAFLTDWGFELRMQMFSNYRIPMFGYFQIAFPTRKSFPDRNNPGEDREVDGHRIYFGFAL